MRLLARLCLFVSVAFAIVVPRAVWAAHEMGHAFVEHGAAHHHSHSAEGGAHHKEHSYEDDNGSVSKDGFVHEHVPGSSGPMSLPPGALSITAPASVAILYGPVPNKNPDLVPQEMEPRPPRPA